MSRISWETVATVVTSLAAATAGIVAVFQFLKSSTNLSRTEAEQVKLARDERHRLEGEQSRDVMATARLSLTYLTEYYSVSKVQVQRSFMASILALVVGLGALIAGISMYYARPSGGVQVAAITTIAGVLANFISGAYFYLLRKAMAQVNYFYANLVRTQDTMIAAQLCRELEAVNDRSSAMRELVQVLIMQSVSRLPVSANEVPRLKNVRAGSPGVPGRSDVNSDGKGTGLPEDVTPERMG
jgi:hypothetical protein